MPLYSSHCLLLDLTLAFHRKLRCTDFVIVVAPTSDEQIGLSAEHTKQTRQETRTETIELAVLQTRTEKESKKEGGRIDS